jgi:GT2 family glycosyltransferase
LDEATLTEWSRELTTKEIEFKYQFFNQNLGFAKGHNLLYRETSESDLLLILNPDAVFPYHLITRLVNFAHTHSDFGVIEARQIPLEHPKEFNLTTGEVPWASGACTLFKSQVFKECNGFDEIFFMYCEDVDLSWRIRANGYKIYYCLDTFIYHSKRLTTSGMEQSETEKYYGPLSAMLLRAKYGGYDINLKVLNWLKNNDEALYKRLTAEYYATIKLIKPATPAQLNSASFTEEGNFAIHRWNY